MQTTDAETFVFKFGSGGSGDGQFYAPEGVEVDNGNIYVADTRNHRIQKFDSAGIFVSKFGTFGSGNGQFHAPAGVSVDIGNIYAVDYGNNRIEVFSGSLPCIPPTLGDWVISSSCTLLASATVPANVIVQKGVFLTIPDGIALNIDFAHNHLLIKSGSGVLIKDGGKIS